QPEGGHAVHGLCHVVALGFEERNECLANLGVVLDDQDGSRRPLGYHPSALSAHPADSSRAGSCRRDRFSNEPCGPCAANFVAPGLSRQSWQAHGIRQVRLPWIRENSHQLQVIKWMLEGTAPPRRSEERRVGKEW